MDPRSTPDSPTLPAEMPSQSDTIGSCRLVRKLGEGGMGEVWLAEQQHPVRRKVALKVIKLGMDTREVVARFAAEQQALALMDHAGIARMFDAGATPEGRPYFVMEFVPGVPLTEYCDTARLTIRERLELFLQICSAVQHAHHKAIIHRDLKPSNVLVSNIEGHPTPKVIDFGIAKAMVTPLTDRTMVTQFGGALGTPEYMSPEQLDPAEVDVDTRSDIYALGVILYELLTGVPPIDTRSAGSFEEVRQRIRSQEPARPSTRLDQLGDEGQQIAARRQANVAGLARTLRGDLDWILLKALEKDRNRRYNSPTDFANDIQRHLGNQPVLARPPSARYRAGRFISRHRFGVAISGAALLSLVGFATAMVILATRLADERDRVTQEMQSKEQIASFLQELFTLSTPERARGRTLTARDVLQRGVEKIDQLPRDQPALRADLFLTMGKAFLSLGLYDEAEGLLRKGHEVAQATTLDSKRSLTAAHDLGHLFELQGRYDESAALLEKAVPEAKASLGARDDLTLSLEERLAVIYTQQNRLADAARLSEYVLQVTRDLRGADSPQAIRMSHNLALVYHRQDRIAEAIELVERVLASRRRTLGSDHPLTLASLNNLAIEYQALKKFQEARNLLNEAIATGERVLGAAHPQLGAFVHSLGEVEFDDGRYEVAVVHFTRALSIYRRQTSHQFLPQLLYQLAQSTARLGRRDDALDFLEQALAAGHKPTLPPADDPHLAALRTIPRFQTLTHR